MINKKLINTGEAAPPPIDPLQNFETVAYKGNGGTQKITGYIRKGAAFNGSDSRINTNDSKAFIADEMSISLWCRLNSTGANRNLISNWNSSGTRDTSFQFKITSANKLELLVYASNDSTDYKQYVSNSALTGLTDWNHFSFTLTSGITAKLYVNGSEVTTTVTNGTTYTSGTINTTGTFDTIIGAIGNAGTGIDGKIDQVRIFNKALSQSEVDTLEAETYDSSTKSTNDIFGDGSGVALYELDEDANDTGKYGRGSIDTGYSFLFNGSSYINPASDPIPSTGAFTVSAWVKTSVSNHCFISFGDFWLKSEYISGVFGLGDLNTNLRGTTDISDGNWHHCALTVDASNNIVLYVDGVIEDTGTKTISRTNGGSFAIGVARLSNPVYYFSGNVDQVKIYSSALSASDIRELISETNAPTANLVAHYKLDGNVVDETTNHDGTWYGVNAYGSPAEFTTYDGTPTNINFLGMAFQPDWVWIKARNDTANHALFDSVRGATKFLTSQSTGSEQTYTDTLTSFDSNGYTVSNSSAVNGNTVNYVAWCWKAGGAAVSNTDGTITSQVSANQDAGFSIVSFDNTTTGNETIGHGLSSAPELIIQKGRDSGVHGGLWFVYHSAIGATDFLRLNDTTQSQTNSTVWNDTEPTDSVFSIGSGSTINNYGLRQIAYCFHSVDGYQKVGSYTGGTGEVDVTTGFKPRWVMIKNTSNSASWVIFDSIRSGTTNPINDVLEADTSDAEAAVGTAHIDIVDNGFQVNNTTSFSINNNGDTYIYLAIA